MTPTTLSTAKSFSKQSILLICLSAVATTFLQQTCTAFVVVMAPQPPRGGNSLISSSSSRLYDTIISPFDNSSSGDDNNDTAAATATTTSTTTSTTKLEGPLDLTWDNVEAVLDEMRPFLIQDGGNVKIQDIDGPVVRLELEVRNQKKCIVKKEKKKKERTSHEVHVPMAIILLH
jgi:NifU-like domain